MILNKTSWRGSFFREWESEGADRTHRTRLTTQAASNGHLTEVLHFMGKEEGAPERLQNKAETPGTPADGGPAHLLPHNYGGEMARQGQRKIRALLCGEGA